MFWTLVFLTQGLGIDIAAYESKADCQEIAYILNQSLAAGGFSCKAYTMEKG